MGVMYILSHFSHVHLFATLWTVALQDLLSMRFSRQEYWSGLPCPPPEDLPDSGIKPMSLISPELQVNFLSLSHQKVKEVAEEGYEVKGKFLS